jgi:hypothetical protein
MSYRKERKTSFIVTASPAPDHRRLHRASSNISPDEPHSRWGFLFAYCAMTFTGVFIGPNGQMGYETGKRYTFTAIKSGVKSMKIITAPDKQQHSFSTESEMLKLWEVGGDAYS